ncbi:exodeoxyribonuclease VII large subunit [Patescibacteria group bacterium]|nr:exodeoxyribonuclease VII large subunit [Patescibacteria group bacterium]MBU1673312.1 exodeoxyribonuclease VII large subunit [Patescibacteria group bacterium]MBU1963569.1 exodeoxyribonuclease VII large subunit [Patescibacteria group bacterium]
MQIYSVSEFNKEINELLAQVPLCVQGEVSEFNISQNRFVWFKLKDDKSSFNCFMMIFSLKQEIEDGMEIKIYGTPGVFQKSGQFRFMVKQIELVGEGSVKKQFELLKKKLEAEGLFDESRKRALPVFPQKIGLVTSESAAAFTDVNRVLNNRWAGLEIIFYNTQVQGDAAIGQIVDGLNHLNEHHPDLDAIILTRGGGSMEDLQAFNTEDVARAIFASNIPIISGVGHERDVTIADYVADKRAATPSNAAELLVPHKDDVKFQIEQIEKDMQNELLRKIENRKEAISRFFGSLDMRINFFKGEIDRYINLLKSYNPGNVLKRGYSITRINNEIVKSVKAVKKGQQLETQLADGKIESITK